jgi:hypothetical protein
VSLSFSLLSLMLHDIFPYFIAKVYPLFPHCFLWCFMTYFLILLQKYTPCFLIVSFDASWYISLFLCKKHTSYFLTHIHRVLINMLQTQLSY